MPPPHSPLAHSSRSLNREKEHERKCSDKQKSKQTHGVRYGILHWMDTDRIIVWVGGNHKVVVRVFLDTGTQICFITKKLAQHLTPIGNGHNIKYVKVGKSLAKIQMYETLKGKLPVTLANQDTAVFTEYLPNVRISYWNKEITTNLWICPESGDKDISLSKSAMHQLGFRLVNTKGDNIWDSDGEPVAEVEIRYGESFAARPEGDLGLSDEYFSDKEFSSQDKKRLKTEPESLTKPKNYFVKRVELKKRYKIPGYHAAQIPCEVRDE